MNREPTNFTAIGKLTTTQENIFIYQQRNHIRAFAHAKVETGEFIDQFDTDELPLGAETEVEWVAGNLEEYREKKGGSVGNI